MLQKATAAPPLDGLAANARDAMFWATVAHSLGLAAVRGICQASGAGGRFRAARRNPNRKAAIRPDHHVARPDHPQFPEATAGVAPAAIGIRINPAREVL